jgi:GH43 family beta-xylosidase
LVKPRTYRNPVYAQSFPDPYVLKYCGEYWAYCTGFWKDGRCFGIMRSSDLVSWEEAGGAMQPLPGEFPCYWAPEVIYSNGRFLMYYSVGNEELMHIRVAVADHPAGPFIDSGNQLTREEFAIDAHVFTDMDGSRHLFYATDFLTHTRIGTGIVRDRMLDEFKLAGEPQPVARASYEWQVYDPKRANKGNVCWHTVEGPFVLKHRDQYYLMFSGGNWQNPTYGVSYAVTEDLNVEGEWRQIADGEAVLPILRTIEQVVGPGHNSVVRGPDNFINYCIYHRWSENNEARVLAIDRMDWIGDRLVILGPTVTNQPIPGQPTRRYFLPSEKETHLSDWKLLEGAWDVSSGTLKQLDRNSHATANLEVPSPQFLLEMTMRLNGRSETGSCGLLLSSGDEGLLDLNFGDMESAATLTRDGSKVDYEVQPGKDFSVYSNSLLRLEVDNLYAKATLNQIPVFEGKLERLCKDISLYTRGAAAEFSGFELTVGWYDLFDKGPLTDRGWTGDLRGWSTEGNLMLYSDVEGNSSIFKGHALSQYEFVVNSRYRAEKGKGLYGFYPAVNSDAMGPLVLVEESQAGWVLLVKDGAKIRDMRLPNSFDPYEFHQFRFIRSDGITIMFESETLGVIEAPQEPTRIGLYASRTEVAYDSVRVTCLT